MGKKLFQKIREKYQLGPASHMTHLSNLDSILLSGGIHSHNYMIGKSYTNLSNEDVQRGRSQIAIPLTGRSLHDYVPLYFGFKTPMVAVNQKDNENLIFFRFSLEVLEKTHGIIVTDGNARSHQTQFQVYSGMDSLAFLDTQAINTVKYAFSNELKRKKQAEILVPDFLSIAEVFDIICFCNSAKEVLWTKMNEFGISRPTWINPGWYFQKKRS